MIVTPPSGSRSVSDSSGGSSSGSRIGGQSGSGSVGSGSGGSRSGNVSGSRPTTQNYTPHDWRYYANPDGQVTSPPNYPDVSYKAWLKAGGNLLGIGYSAWKDSLLAAYNTAYNMYQQWYDSTEQQVSRITAAGLNTNLAYGMASPGSSPGGAMAQSSGQTPGEVMFNAVGAAANLFGGIKTLAEAATIVSELPESQFKGRLAKQLDVAAAAGAVNSENAFMGSLNAARVALGVGNSKAQREQSENAYQTARNAAESSILDYMTSHDSEGSESDFEGSLYTQGKIAGTRNQILEYTKNKQEWDSLLSHPEYYKAILDKMVNEATITRGQAFQIEQILNDPNMDDRSKYLALQPGLPGFLSKLSFSITSQLIDEWNNLKNMFNNPFSRKG